MQKSRCFDNVVSIISSRLKLKCVCAADLSQECLNDILRDVDIKDRAASNILIWTITFPFRINNSHQLELPIKLSAFALLLSA